jgi:hypothetical protein
LIVMLAVGAVGSWLIAQAFASRRTLIITAPASETEETPSSSRAGQIAAYMSQIRSPSATRIDVPPAVGSDGFDPSSIKTIGGSKVAAIFLAIVQAVFATVPWRAEVSQNTGGLSVAIFRNGRTVEIVTVDVTQFSPPSPPPASPAKRTRRTKAVAVPVKSEEEIATELAKSKRMADKLVAAAIIAAMGRVDRTVDGLGGRKDWRSIGLHYLATSEFPSDIPRATSLLKEAVRFDSTNVAALIALQNFQHRFDTEPGQLRSYARLLTAQLRDGTSVALPTINRLGRYRLPRESAELRLRLLLVRVAIGRNLHASETGREHSDELADSLQFAVELVLLLSQRRFARLLGDDEKILAAISLRTLRAAVARDREPLPMITVSAHVAQIKSAGDFRTAQISNSPVIAYSFACHLVHSGFSSQTDLLLRALGIAFYSPELKRWAPKDPELAPISKAKWFLQMLERQ